MEENVENTNSSPSSALELQHVEPIPVNGEEASPKEAGGWRSVKYIIGMFTLIRFIVLLTNMMFLNLMFCFFIYIKEMSRLRNWHR